MIHWHYIAWILAAVAFGLALLGVFGAGMASRATTSKDYAFPRKCAIVGAALILLTVAACTTREGPVTIETVEVIKEVPRDCPGERPERPARLGELPQDAIQALALVGAKLAEYSGSGKYADRVEAIFDRCPLSPPAPAP